MYSISERERKGRREREREREREIDMIVGVCARAYVRMAGCGPPGVFERSSDMESVTKSSDFVLYSDLDRSDDGLSDISIEDSDSECNPAEEENIDSEICAIFSETLSASSDVFFFIIFFLLFFYWGTLQWLIK